MTKRLALILGAAVLGFYLGALTLTVCAKLSAATEQALKAGESRDEANLDSSVMDY